MNDTQHFHNLVESMIFHKIHCEIYITQFNHSNLNINTNNSHNQVNLNHTFAMNLTFNQLSLRVFICKIFLNILIWSNIINRLLVYILFLTSLKHLLKTWILSASLKFCPFEVFLKLAGLF